MSAFKALLLVLIGGTVLTAGVFAFVPNTRPAIVKKWFRNASGFKPAETPQQAVDRFKDCIKKRDYETAAELYCTGDYREQMLKVAAKAKELGNMIDSLIYNMDTKGVNNPNTKFMVRLLEPFPKTFTVADIKTKDNTAVATFGPDDDVINTDKPLPADFLVKHGLMVNSLLPTVDPPLKQVKLVKDASGFWKLDFPVTSRLRLSVEYLRENATNYRNGIQQVRDEVKNNPATKEGIQAELERRLNESK